MAEAKISLKIDNEEDLDRVKEKATRLVELLKEAKNIIESLGAKAC